MVSISSWTSRTVSVSIDVEGLPLSLKVRPNFMTPEKEILLSESSGKDSVNQLLNFFCEYVAEWDVTDDDGNVLAITPAVVGSLLPSNIIKTILIETQTAVDKLGN